MKEIAPRITVDESTCGGRPVIRGTRVPVALIVEQLAGGDTIEAICRAYHLERDDVEAAIQYAEEKKQRREERAKRFSEVRIISLHEEDGGIDRELLSRIPPHERMEMLWDLTLQYLAWSNQDVGEPRLQRSVVRVERRGR